MDEKWAVKYKGGFMKRERQAKIIEIIRQKDIETQEELAMALNSLGYQVTQATVSRDIRELQLTKTVSENGKQKYEKKEDKFKELDSKYLRILKEGFVSVDMAQNILVIKTVAGMAMAVAAALDALQWKEIVGCIAGDDTIMCAVRSVEDTKRVMRKIREIIND